MTGSIVTFDDAIPFTPIEKLVVQIEPVQSGSGDPSPDNIRPISGWTGLEGKRTGKNLLKLDESEMVSTGWNRRFPISLKAGTYIISCQNQFGASTKGASVDLTDENDATIIKALTSGYTFGDTTFVGTAATITEEEAKKIKNIRFALRAGGTTYNDIAQGNIQLELGSTASDYEPYQGSALSISWQSTAGTVYGGNIVVNEDGSGVLTAEYALWTKNTATMNNGNSYPGWRSAGIKEIIGAEKNQLFQNHMLNIGSVFAVNTVSNYDILYLPKDVYSKTEDEWKSLAVDVQVVAKLATPLVYSFTNLEQLTTLLGTNNIWADTGDVSVTYQSTDSGLPLGYSFGSPLGEYNSTNLHLFNETFIENGMGE